MKRLVLGLAFLACASVAHAQPPLKWTLAVYNKGAAAPLSPPLDLLLIDVTCNVDPSTLTATGANPKRVLFDDNVNAGKVCVWVDSGNGPLLSTPFGGSYEATLSVTNTGGTSPESARAPFTHPGVALPAPTGVKLGK